MDNSPDKEEDSRIPHPVIDASAIRSALRQWHNLSALSQHPLATLLIVDQRIKEAHRDPNTYGRGLSFQKILREAINKLKPVGEEEDANGNYRLAENWRSYVVIEEFFLNNRKRDAVADFIGLSASRTSDKITDALNQIAGILYQWEEECKSRKSIKSPSTEDSLPTKSQEHSQLGTIDTGTDSQISTQPEPISTELPTQQKAQLKKVALVGAGIVAILIVLVFTFPYPNAKPDFSSLPTQWCDTFDEMPLDNQRWGLMADKEKLIFVQDGVLNFKADRLLNEDILGAELVALPIGRPVKEISFTSTLVSAQGNVPAGAGIGVFLQDGRDFAVMFGPGYGGPELEFYKCQDSLCNGEYEKYSTSRIPIAVGVPFSVHLASTTNVLNFHVGDFFYKREDIEGWVDKVQFSMFAEPDSNLHVVVDNVCIIYGN